MNNIQKRKLPHGREEIGVLGLGMGGIEQSSDREIEETVRVALEQGINFFDLCAAARHVYKPFGKAIAGQRDKIFFQLHLGAVYNDKGEYGWSRDLDEIKKTFDWELETLNTDYVDFGFLHCVDEMEDIDELIENGIIDYLKELKEKGIVHHLGFSSHTPAVAQKLLDSLPVDLMMFSINPAYDYEQGDELGIGSNKERLELFKRAESIGVGISVMKPFFGGKLLDEKHSPFHQALSKNQLIQYALDRPGVLTVVPGVRGLQDLKELLKFREAGQEEKDYSIISEFSPAQAMGSCVYCNHCQPCPAGIDIALVNKYYDLALAGDKLARNHYDKLSIKADACLQCGHCDSRCPFQTKQSERMVEIANYFS